MSSFAADRPQDIACGDFDGDGRWDVAARFPTQVEWLWGDGKGRFATAALSNALISSGSLLGADLDDDHRADLVGPSAQGLEVWRGASERPPLPVAYSPFPLSAQGARVIPIRTTMLSPEALALALFADGPGSAALLATFADGRMHARTTLDDGHGIERIAPDVGVGDLTADGTDDVALAFVGTSTVRLYSPRLDLITAEWQLRALPGAEAVQVSAPKVCEGCSEATSGFTVDAGVALADLDDDGEKELLVSLKGANGPAVAVARRAPGGGFAEPYLYDGFAPLAIDGDGAASSGRAWPLALVPTGTPLLVVGANGIYELAKGTAPKLCRVHARSTPEPWTHAVVADLDGDQSLDVAAISAGKPFVDVQRRTAPSGCGQNGAFNTRRYSLAEGAWNIESGNLRGNAGRDLVVVTGGKASAENALRTLWSDFGDWPQEPTLVARLEPVQDVAVGRSAHPGTQSDFLDDVWVTTNDKAGASGFGVLYSDGGQRLASPYALYHHSGSKAPKQGAPQSVLFGGFFGRGKKSSDLGLLVFGETTGAGPLLWPLALRAHAQFQPVANSVLLRSQIASDFTLDCARFAAGDFDGDGRDEVAGVFGPVLCGGGAPGEGPVGVVLGSFEGSADFTMRKGSLASKPLVLLTTADLDGDSLSDVVLLEAARVRVLWGDADWLEGAPADVELPELAVAASPLGVRAGGTRARLVIGTEQGLWTLSADRQRHLELVRVADGSFDALYGADVDGDGLDDLVALAETELATLRTLPSPTLGGG